jgi:hypothetical protein
LSTDGSVEQWQDINIEKQLRKEPIDTCGWYATGERMVPTVVGNSSEIIAYVLINAVTGKVKYWEPSYR